MSKFSLRLASPDRTGGTSRDFCLVEEDGVTNILELLEEKVFGVQVPGEGVTPPPRPLSVSL